MKSKPKLLLFWKSHKCNLTGDANEVLGLFRFKSRSYEASTNEKQDKSCDLSCLVDYTGKSSNFFEDLAALDAYSQSVENEIDTHPYWFQHNYFNIIALIFRPHSIPSRLAEKKEGSW